LAASLSETSRIGTVGAVSTRGSEMDATTRSNGPIGIVAVPVPDATTSSVAM